LKTNVLSCEAAQIHIRILPPGTCAAPLEYDGAFLACARIEWDYANAKRNAIRARRRKAQADRLNFGQPQGILDQDHLNALA
jgi:hypothetical protein